MFIEIRDNVIALVQCDATVVVDEERDLILAAEFQEFVVGLLVPNLAAVEAWIVRNVR